MTAFDWEKESSIQREFFLDWRKTLVKQWGPGRRYQIGDIVRAISPGTGFYYKIVGANDDGISGGVPPEFEVEAGQTWKDGSCTWTTFRPDDAGLFTISTSVWTEETGITVVSDRISNFLTAITLSGGTDGEFYRLLNDITLSDGRTARDSAVLKVADTPSTA